MKIALLLESGELIDGNTLPWRSQTNDWCNSRNPSKLFFSQPKSGLFEVVVSSFESGEDLCNSDIFDEIPLKIVALNPLNTRFVYDDKECTEKSFYRIFSSSASDRRIQGEEARLFLRAWKRVFRKHLNLFLSIMFAKNLGMENAKVKNLARSCSINSATTENSLESDLDTICNLTPTCNIIVSYQDPIIEKKIEEPLEIALLSFFSFEDESKEEEEKMIFEICRYELDKEGFISYLKLCFSLWIEKYIVLEESVSIDSALKEVLIEQIVQNFISYMDHPCCPSLYQFASSLTYTSNS
jgi:hypothetical protein